MIHSILCFSLAIVVVAAVNKILGIAASKQQQSRVWVHIGESKTATTYIQLFLERHHQDIAMEGLRALWLRPKIAQGYAQPEAIDDLIENTLREGMDLLISSEFIESYTTRKLADLHRRLQKFDEIFIIVTIREPLCRAISAYHENSLFYFPPPFGMEMLHHINREPSLDFWASTLGADNIHVIDYYGVESSHKDIIHVLLCEVTGYYCSVTSGVGVETEEQSQQERSTSSASSSKSSNVNQSKDYTLLPLFHYLLAATRRKMCPAAPHNTLKDAWNLLNEVVLPNNSLPIIEFDGMDILRQLADDQYSKMLNNYSSFKWHHKNITANKDARNAVRYSVLAMWQMMELDSWQQWLDNLVDWFTAHGFVNDCTGFRVFPGYLQPRIHNGECC